MRTTPPVWVHGSLIHHHRCIPDLGSRHMTCLVTAKAIPSQETQLALRMRLRGFHLIRVHPEVFHPLTWCLHQSRMVIFMSFLGSPSSLALKPSRPSSGIGHPASFWLPVIPTSFLYTVNKLVVSGTTFRLPLPLQVVPLSFSTPSSDQKMKTSSIRQLFLSMIIVNLKMLNDFK